MQRYMNRRKSLLHLMPLLLAVAVSTAARANGIANGDFEAGPASWSAHPPAPAPGDRPVVMLGIGLPAPGPGNQHLGWLGNRAAGGCNPSALYQAYDCQPPLPPANPHCTVTFDANLHLAAGEVAGIVLRNAAGASVIGAVPAGGPATYRMSIPGCMPTVVAFVVADPGGGPVNSVFMVDNVLCECTDGNQSQLQQPDYPLPWEPPLPEDQPGDQPEISDLPADCNGNGIPDVIETAEGEAPDSNGNGIPDQCECPGDRDGNGHVDVDDLVLVLLTMGSDDPQGDADGNGFVDVDDLVEVILGWGRCFPAPEVWGHAPDVLADGTVLTLFGNGFSMDPADNQLDLLTPEDDPIPTRVQQIFDLDGDGDGDVIEAMIDGLLESDDGLPLLPILRSGAGDAFGQPGDPGALVFASPDGDDAESPDEGQGQQAQATSEQLRGRQYGEWIGGATRRYRIAFPPGLNWAANTTYRLDIQFTVKFQAGGGSIKTQRYRLQNTTMTSDATPTQAECLDAMVAKLNAVLSVTATPGERTQVFNTFEWVRNGSNIELRRKAGAGAGDPHLVDFGGNRNRPVIVYQKVG